MIPEELICVEFLFNIIFQMIILAGCADSVKFSSNQVTDTGTMTGVFIVLENIGLLNPIAVKKSIKK